MTIQWDFTTLNLFTQGGYYTSNVAVVSGTPATNVEVVPHNRFSLQFGYGPDDGGGYTADTLIYLTNRFGPISSFSGSYRADRWTVNIERSSGNYAHQVCRLYQND